MHRQIRELILAVALVAPVFAACQKSAPEPTPAAAAPAADSGPAFDLHAEAPESLAAGEKGTLAARVVAREGYKVNEEYPASFRPKGSDGIRFEKERFTLADGFELVPCAGKEEPCELHAKLPFTAEAEGDLKVEGTLAFSVCNPDRCLIEKEEVSVAVRVR